MVGEGHYASDDIEAKVRELTDKWNAIKAKAAGRKDDLDGALQVQQYYADANEAESWMKEKEPAATSADFGKDEDSSQALLKKHEALMADIDAYGKSVDGLRDASQECKVKRIFFFCGKCLWYRRRRISSEGPPCLFSTLFFRM